MIIKKTINRKLRIERKKLNVRSENGNREWKIIK